MFLLYALIYAGFVALNVTRPTVMEVRLFWGLNLAVVYGFFLIIFALVLALIYNRLCNRKEFERPRPRRARGRTSRESGASSPALPGRYPSPP